MKNIVQNKHIPKVSHIDGLVIYYDNQDAMAETYSEIFIEQPYYFEADNDSPSIIDGGGNIGLSVLYFKKLYPKASIICFEPDVNAYKCLIKNIESNKLTNVLPVNVALSNNSGKISFFGHIKPENPDARGNSILENWGMQRTTSSIIEVNSVLLSTYINKPVDYLKLDIEGAEQAVLFEIADKLHFIKQIGLEVHQTEQIKAINSIETIASFLKENKFNVSFTEKTTSCYFPEEIAEWVAKNRPSLYQLYAIRFNNDI